MAGAFASDPWSLGCTDASRRIAASTATTAGSSIRSGRPSCTRGVPRVVGADQADGSAFLGVHRRGGEAFVLVSARRLSALGWFGHQVPV
jgi:hypothetical protein